MRRLPVAILISANRSSASSRSSMPASAAGASERESARSCSTTSASVRSCPSTALGTNGGGLPFVPRDVEAPFPSITLGANDEAGAGHSSATVSAVSPT